MKERTKKESALDFADSEVSLAGYVWIFTCLSFFGWCFEKIGRYFLYPGDPIRDRGFLTLPFCTIYGTCAVLIGFFLGAPNRPSRFLKSFWRRTERFPAVWRNFLHIFVYFFSAMLLATAAELVAGGIFKLMGIPLWNYSERWGNLWGVICPSYSLLWGVLITLVMHLIWNPICRLVLRIPPKVLRVAAVCMVVVLSTDFLFNCIYVAVTGGRFYFL